MTKDDADGGVRGFCSSLSSPSRSGARLLFGILLEGRRKDVSLLLFVSVWAAREREIPFFAIVEWYTLTSDNGIVSGPDIGELNFRL